MYSSATSYEKPRSFFLVGHKAVSTDAQEGSQTPFRRVESVQILLLKQPRKEILRQILRVFVRFAPADAHIFVDRFPVRGSDRFERARTLRRIIATRGQHSGPMRSGKPSVSPAD